MMNLDQVIANFMTQDTTLGRRVQKAVAYRDARAAGEISPDEYRELLRDLQRLDDIQLSANELDQQTAFNACINALLMLPL